MSTSDPFVFRFIGSNLKNLLLGSARGREFRETRVLYERARAAYRWHPLSKEEDRNKFIVDLIFEASNRSDRFPSKPLLLALCDLAGDLLARDGVTNLPEMPSFETLSIEEGVAIRSHLWRLLRFTEDWDRLFGIWRHKITSLINGILDSLPASAFGDDELASGSADPVSRLSAPLIDLCDNPAVVVERTMATMYDDDIVGAHLFDEVRERLEHNLCAASDIPWEKRHESSRSVVTPGSYRAASNEELANTYLGGTPYAPFFAAALPFVIPFPARFEHTHVVGGTGHGKTQLMQLLIHHDLLKAKQDERSIIVIDSQGDLIRTVSNLALFRPDEDGSLANRLILIDPNDVEYPVCLNMFDWNRERLTKYGALEREKLLNSTVELYEYFFGALLGAELTQRQGVIFRYIARLMMEIPNATIQTLRKLMENGEPFRPYMARLPGSAHSFFETRFFDRTFNETKKQILTRLWGVLSNATLERMFSHPKNKVDIYESINSGKIILINTAKDLLKQEGCAIFGRFFISLIAQASIERASIPPHERRPTFLYIDEAQDYFDDNIGYLLNQARKYRVGMLFAHQNLDQLAPGLRSSVMASTSIKLAGGISAKDARAFAEEMRCKDDLLLSTKKRQRHSEFACYVRNLTPQAIKLTVPLGFVESQPTLRPSEHRALIDGNRVRCAVRIEDMPPFGSPPVEPDPVGWREPPVQTGDPESPHFEIQAEQAPIEGPQKLEVPPGTKSSRPPRKPREVRPDPAPMGRGGRQHKYLQHLLKGAAQERGYLAIIEEPVLGGAGKVDLSLNKNGLRIACEISVTTGKDWELGNIEKCLAAGYDQVILVTADDRQLKAMSKFVAGQLEEAARDRVLFLTPDAAIAHLDELDAGAAPPEETIRGYRVKVTRSKIDPEETRARRQSIAAVLARSLRGA